ncbi:cytochrome P450 [Colletotrichum zoysiae]|uniref:Cytochrome P450 n=1 Tax=Colletotrichum zoysiae TaxID=1216348 RepID=A0AAD9LVZ6_9PEZI|nr:cytochrome P450 [Colletotrichum zoysiae]
MNQSTLHEARLPPHEWGFLTQSAFYKYVAYRDVIWRVTQPQMWLVLSIRFAKELHKLPDDVIGIQKVRRLNFQSDYTYILPNNPLIQSTIRSDLTLHLPQVVGGLSKEVARTVPEVLVPCEEWNIIAIVSGYVFIGPELCRHPKYLDATKSFARNAFGAAASLKQWPKSLCWFAARFVDARVAELRKQRANLIEFLTPYVEERRALRDQAKDSPQDMLQWAVNKAPKFKIDTNAELTNVQAVLSIVAIETTTTLATHFLFDIVAHCPEIIPEEVRSVLEENGGVYTAKALAQMKLMDSVVKDSLRCNPQSLNSFSRLVKKEVTLSDGTVLPKDETYYPEANRFNPYRFIDLRSGKAENPLQYQNKELISVTKENISFGFGRHSCPGRFFASNKIKVIMAELLTNYDVRLADGVTEWYKNIVNGDIVTADASKAISFKRRGRR